MLAIVNTKNGGHVISPSEERGIYIVLVYNVYPFCKIKNLCKIRYLVYTGSYYIDI
jgi:hypothetical protein